MSFAPDITGECFAEFECAAPLFGLPAGLSEAYEVESVGNRCVRILICTAKVDMRIDVRLRTRQSGVAGLIIHNDLYPDNNFQSIDALLRDAVIAFDVAKRRATALAGRRC